MESSQDSKVKKYILKGTPYGETKFVLKDLEKLVDKLDINDPSVSTVLKEHNEEHLAIVGDTGADGPFVITKHNSDGDDYIDQRNGHKYTISPADLKVQSTSPYTAEHDEKVEEYRKSFEDLLKTYTKDYYGNNAGYNVTAKGTHDNFTISLAVTGKNLNFDNFYGGEWLSEWTLTNSSLEGSVRINAHYFEDGNVQMKINKPFKKDISVEKDGAKAVVDFITKTEDDVLKGIDTLYEGLLTDVFKTMRRELPVTKTKMDWNIHVHKVVSSLKAK